MAEHQRNLRLTLFFGNAEMVVRCEGLERSPR